MWLNGSMDGWEGRAGELIRASHDFANLAFSFLLEMFAGHLGPRWWSSLPPHFFGMINGCTLFLPSFLPSCSVACLAASAEIIARIHTAKTGSLPSSQNAEKERGRKGSVPPILEGVQAEPLPASLPLSLPPPTLSPEDSNPEARDKGESGVKNQKKRKLFFFFFPSFLFHPFIYCNQMKCVAE